MVALATAPMIEKTIAAILDFLVVPDWSNPANPRMSAAASTIQPTVSDAGMHAKTVPTTAAISAIGPSLFFRPAGRLRDGGRRV